MRVELNNIRKYFGPVRANDGITIDIDAGSIHGLLGENGAGKSTLMKVLSGFISADGGEVRLDNRPVTFHSPADAIRKGVGMLHQDPLDFPPLRLIDNFLTGRNNGLLLGKPDGLVAFLDLCRQFDFDLDPYSLVGELTVGERQQLEIVRLLWLGVNVLILDEPTTGISAPQKVKLFRTLKLLAEQGKTVIFVSHKLEDVEELCARATVLRQGRVTGAAEAPFRTEDLVRMMFGQVITLGNRSAATMGSPVLALRDAAMTDQRGRMERVNLSVREGEVIGLAGLEGSGQRLLMMACAGLLPLVHGSINIDGVDLTRRRYDQFVAAGVTYMPADRMAEGLIPGLTITEHIVLAEQRQERRKKSRRIDWKQAGQDAVQAIKEFNIKGRPDSPVESLSGGNQQRALLALLPETLRLLLMAHPTRGLDVESAIYIWNMLLARRQEGTAIIFSSADLDEVFQYSDRIVVCFNGQILDVLQTSETSIEALGYLIGGKKPQETP